MQIITTHTGTDFDGLAATVAARKIYPEAKICLPGSVAKEVSQFICVYGKILQAIPVEKVNLDTVDRLILVDTRWVNRLGIFRQLIGKRGVEIHLYDHHPPHPQDIEGDGGVCKEVGATTSILVHIIKEQGISVVPSEATLFALGIYEDTGSLSFASTTPWDLEAAGFLLSQGANLELISSFLNGPLTEKQNLLLNDFLEKAKVRLINGVEVVVIVTEIDEFVGGLSLPLHKFIDLRNLEVVFTLIKSKDRTYLLGRSRTPSVNVSEILSAFGGGGHNFAASALIKEGNLKELEHKLYRVLEDKIGPRVTVSEAMSSPVRTASPGTSLKEAKKILNEHGVEDLPVMDDGKVVGIISRTKLDHLMAHNSEKTLLKSYLSPKVPVISPYVSIKKAQQVMMEEETRGLLVMEGEKLVGIITGSDLLEAFHGKKKNLRVGKNRETIKNLLETRIPKRVHRILQQAGRTATELGYRAFIVGGFVRDLLLGIENLDVDLVIEGDGIKFAAQFARELGGKVKKYPEFGTAVLTLADGFKLDVATARKEFYPQPAALPEVEPASLQEDLSRRDFTVNTMAIDLNPDSFGNLIDFFGGQLDLEQRKVRVLHEDSFIEDPTRVFRAVRFEQRYGFTLEERTARLTGEALRSKALSRLSGERVREELIQILEEDRPGKVIHRMQELGVLEAVHPKLQLTREKEKKLDYLVDIFARFQILFPREVKRWLIRLLLLLDDMSEAEVEEFCQRYRFSKEERDSLIRGRLEAEKIVRKLSTPGSLAPSFIYHLLEPFSQEVLLFAISKTREKMLERRIFHYLAKLKQVKVEIDGNDLKCLGYPPSPRLGQILEELKKARLDGRVKTKEEEIKYVRDNFPPKEKK
ncbi:MAG: CBS domain-containing protein [bacterium]